MTQCVLATQNVRYNTPKKSNSVDTPKTNSLKDATNLECVIFGILPPIQNHYFIVISHRMGKASQTF